MKNFWNKLTGTKKYCYPPALKFRAGIKDDGTPWYFNVKPILPNNTFPQKISAVCGLISPAHETDRFIIIKNKRGYDIPGGHVKLMENPLSALIRETSEEAGAEVFSAYPVALLESDFYLNQTTYIVIYRGLAALRPFISSEEIFQRKILLPKDFLAIYYGNSSIIEYILEMNCSRAASP